MNSGKEIVNINTEEERVKKVIDAGAEFVKAILPFAMSALAAPEEEPVRKTKRKKTVKKSSKKKDPANTIVRNTRPFEPKKKITEQFPVIDPPAEAEKTAQIPT
jgi:hypothetical protein